jgi:prolyl oligopeptidase
MHKLIALAALALAATPALAQTAVAPPVAEIRNQPSQFHGTTVNDPYRWLEDTKSPAVRTWLRGQGDAARSVLDRIDGRDAIAKRLAELADAQGDSIRGLRQMPGERWYYMKRSAGAKQFKLMLREGAGGAEKLLVDPEEAARRTGVPHAINYYHASWDGRYLAYGMSAGGSEDASLYVLDITSGKLVGAPIPRVYDTPVHWLPDSKSFTFTQLALLKKGAHETETYMDARVLLKRVGGALTPVFGPTVTRSLKLDRLDVAEVMTVPGSAWAVARTTDTTVPEGKMFVTPLAGLGKPGAVWRRIAGPEDKVVDVALQGDTLAVMTQAGAPHRKIVGVDLKQGDLRNAALLAAEPKDGVLEGFELTPGGLVAELRMGTQVQLRRHDKGDSAGRLLPAPAAGTARLAAAPAHHTEALAYAFSGWTEPSRNYRLDGDRSVDLVLGQRALPPGLPELQVTDVNVPSHDGVLVPMTILHKKGLALDGRNPVLLHGYASYGSTISAYFSTDEMVWIERGGVSAFLNPRGSGVYGDEWHRAGFKATKPNTWKDGIAAAKYLIAKGYGSAKTMGIMGTSAGGIFVGRATTEAPELFAAAVYNVGALDTVRAEDSANGITNISEFGTVKDPAEFKALLEMSTYHAIKDGTAYPGVLLVHGMNDPRVEVWNSSKTAARLQAAQKGLPDARPALLRLDMQAGHGIGSTVTQRQAQTADVQAFMLWQMGKLGLKD